MKTSYGALIKYLREERGLSQAEVAKRTKMSRASFVAVEQGSKELSLAEAKAITQLFGITIDELLQTQVPNEAKYKEMMKFFLRAAREHKVTLKKTKLAKLLYLADFSWYYVHKESMSGCAYRKVDYGPVADVYFRLLDAMELGGEVNIKQVVRDDYHMYEIEETRASQKNGFIELEKKELAHLGKVWQQWQDANTAEIVKFTHEQQPYVQSGEGELIAYELILQEEVHHVF